MKHLAWLDAALEPLKKQDKTQTRREQLGPHFMTKMPELEYAHVYEWWESLNRYKFSNSGIIPLDFTEIYCWSRATNTRLIENEAYILNRLSFEYVSMYNKACKRDCPAPYTPEQTQSDLERAREHTANQMRRLKEQLKNG